MKNVTDRDYALRTEDGQPDIKAMAEAINDAAALASTEIDYMARDENTRYCWWPDQQDNGRKPDTVNGREAQPWPQASDVRVRLADSLINYDVKLCKSAARRARLTVRGTESGDMRDAGKMQLYVDHLRHTRLKRSNLREAELATQFRQTYGKALTAVTWQQEWALEYVEVTQEDLIKAVQEAQQQGQSVPQAEMLALLIDPALHDDAAEMLVKFMPPLDKAEANRQVKAFSRDGVMVLPKQYLRVNEPRREALKLWRDVWFPVNTEDVQRAPWIAWRRTFSPAEIEEKQASEQWNEEFCAAVIDKVGMTVVTSLGSDSLEAARRESYRSSEEEMEGRCEVFYFYHTITDDRGVPTKQLTVMSPHIMGAEGFGFDEAPVGLDQPVGYDHGMYPFVEHRRERTDRQLVGSRGVAEIVMTDQASAKHLRDARINQTDLVLQPPVIRPEREIGLPLTLRPRGEVGERKMNATRQMVMPNTAPAGEPLEESAVRDAMRYFARNREEDQVAAGLYDQDLADDFCDEEAEVWRMLIKLCQQFENEMTFQRIVGGATSKVHLTREEIQGEFDLQMFYNTDINDPERLKAKVELYHKMILPSSQGEIDNAPVSRGLMAYYFPEFADEAMRDNGQASQKEIEDEENNWTKMMGTVEPTMKEEGQNFQLRMQWLEQQMAKPESAQLLQALPWFEPLVGKRMEHLRFMVQQKTTNAQTGRVGVQAGR